MFVPQILIDLSAITIVFVSIPLILVFFMAKLYKNKYAAYTLMFFVGLVLSGKLDTIRNVIDQPENKKFDIFKDFSYNNYEVRLTSIDPKTKQIKEHVMRVVKMPYYHDEIKVFADVPLNEKEYVSWQENSWTYGDVEIHKHTEPTAP